MTPSGIVWLLRPSSGFPWSMVPAGVAVRVSCTIPRKLDRTPSTKDKNTHVPALSTKCQHMKSIKSPNTLWKTSEKSCLK